MKCPRCRRENPDEALSCVECGLPFVSVRNGGSKVGRVVVGVLKTICYVLLMVGVQSMVYYVYTLFALASDSTLLYDSALDMEAVFQRVVELIYENVTMLTLVSNLLTILILSLFFTLRKKDPMEEVMLRPVRRPWRVAALCMLYGTALNIFFSVTLSLLPLPDALLEAVDVQYAGLYGQTSLLVEILNTAVVTGLLEEIVFRGLALSRLQRGTSRAAAVIISAVIFGVLHGAFLAVCYATILGVVLALLANRYDSIVPTVLCHIFFNLTSYWFTAENVYVVMGLYFAAVATLIVVSYLLFRPDAESEGENSGEEEKTEEP